MAVLTRVSASASRTFAWSPERGRSTSDGMKEAKDKTLRADDPPVELPLAEIFAALDELP